MASPKKKKPTKKNGKVVISSKAKIKKKGAQNDSIPKAPTRLPADAGANFKIRLRKKR